MANEVEVDIGLDTKALLDSLKSVEVAVNRLGNVTGSSIAKMADQTQTEIKKLGKGVEKEALTMRGQLEKVGSSMLSSFTIGNIAANAITSAFSAIKNQVSKTVDDIIQFRRALVEIETILPKNEKLTEKLVKQLEDLSVQYGTSAASQAKAYYEIISAGVTDVADANELLIRSNELATGGLADIEGTIDILTSIYNVYGKEVISAAEASDTLFKTVQLGKTTIPELQNDIGRVLPLAQSFGVSLEEVGTAMVGLTNSGIRTREAVSYLTALFVAISRQGKELGPTMNAAAVQTDGFATVLQRVIEKTGGSNEKLIQLLGTSEAVRAVQALAKGGLDNYNKTLGEFANKSGIAAEASRKVLDKDVGKQWDQLTEAINKSSRALLNDFAPAVSKVIEATKKLFESEYDTSSLEEKLKIQRQNLEWIKYLYESGTYSATQYANAQKLIAEKMAEITKAMPTAQNPLISQLPILQERARQLSVEIDGLKNGFDALGRGPIESSAALVKLESELKNVNLQISEFSKKKINPKELLGGDGELEAQTDKIKSLNAEISSLNATMDLTLATLNAPTIATQDNIDPFAQKQAEIDAEFEYSAQKILIKQEEEDAKAEATLKGKEKEAQVLKNAADAQNKIVELALAKDKKSRENAKAAEDAMYNARLATANNFLQAGINITKQGSAANKALMVTQATIDTWAGANRVLADATIPVLAKPAFIASTIALGLSNVSRIMGLQFADGGIVPGNSYSGDNVQARLNSSEMVLNRQQQAQLFRQANGEGGSNESLLGAISSLGDRIERMSITVQANGREIARLVREENRSGFAFS